MQIIEIILNFEKVNTKASLLVVEIMTGISFTFFSIYGIL